MSAIPDARWTVEQYLTRERASSERHEYLDGVIVAMAGASARHNLIVGNLYASLHSQLRNRPCVVYPSDLRLKVPKTQLYTYPDISVVCGAPQFEDAEQDTLLNPTVIVEVLSPSTESYDRGKKFQHYRALESLEEYVLVAQDSRRIEQYVRQVKGQWLLRDIHQPEAYLELASIECRVPLADVYEKVSFDAE
jgi:Uma2 family endonuclease